MGCRPKGGTLMGCLFGVVPDGVSSQGWYPDGVSRRGGTLLGCHPDGVSSHGWYPDGVSLWGGTLMGCLIGVVP